MGALGVLEARLVCEDLVERASMTDCEDAYGLMAMTLALGEALATLMSGLLSRLGSLAGAWLASGGGCVSADVDDDALGVRFVTLTILAPLNVCGTKMLLLLAIE